MFCAIPRRWLTSARLTRHTSVVMSSGASMRSASFGGERLPADRDSAGSPRAEQDPARADR
jgi:hypothetical protein